MIVERRLKKLIACTWLAAEPSESLYACRSRWLWQPSSMHLYGMNKMLSFLPDLGLLLLRVVPSGMMMTHGWPKFNRLMEQ